MEHAHLSPPYNPELIEAFIAKFINRFDVYPIQKANGGYAAIKQPLTPDVIEGHLRGTHTIGAYALSSEDKGKFLVVDTDTEPVWQQVLEMAARLEENAIPVWRELSRRGGHLWLFLPSLPGLLIRRFAVQLLTELYVFRSYWTL